MQGQSGQAPLHPQSLTLCIQCSFKGWPQSCKHKARTCEKEEEMSELLSKGAGLSHHSSDR